MCVMRGTCAPVTANPAPEHGRLNSTRMAQLQRRKTYTATVEGVRVGSDAPVVDGLDRLGIRVPIIGDFHYNGHILLKKYPDCAKALAKYRINPGNVSIGKKDDDNFRTMIEVAIENDKPVRIGVNWGSLDSQLLTRLMDENSKLDDPMDARDVTMEAMVQSALRSADLAVSYGMRR